MLYNGIVSPAPSGGRQDATNGGLWSFNGNKAIRIGASISNNNVGLGATAGFWDGDISDLRLSRIARYTSGVTSASGGSYTRTTGLPVDAFCAFKLGQYGQDEVTNTLLQQYNTNSSFASRS